MARIGKLYKLVKLTRLIRVLKIMKERSKLLKYLNDILKMGAGFERLFFFLLIFFMFCHLMACLWVLIASIDGETGEESNKWTAAFPHDNVSELYMVAFYWTVTTLSTVGYGDISGTNAPEMLFCSLAMFVGVMAFSVASGSLASIIQSYDQTNAETQEKMVTLNKIYRDYCLPLDLFTRLRKSIIYENEKDLNEVNNFLESLNHNLKMEMSLYIYEDRYNRIKFFRGRLPSFICWLCPLLKPAIFSDQ